MMNSEGNNYRSECTAEKTDVCDGQSVYIVGDEPGGSIEFAAPVLPSCDVTTAARGLARRSNPAIRAVSAPPP